MKDLERIIQENRESFDYHEPDVGHLEMFNKKLNRQRRLNFFKSRKLMQLAAAITLVVGLGSVLYVTDIDKNGDELINSVYASEYFEAERYYKSLIDDKIVEINKLVSSDMHDEKEIIKELTREDVPEQLSEEFRRNPEDERVHSAMMIHFQQRIEILDNILDHLKRADKIIKEGII